MDTAKVISATALSGMSISEMCCEAEQPVIDALNPRDAMEADVARILRVSL